MKSTPSPSSSEYSLRVPGIGADLQRKDDDRVARSNDSNPKQASRSIRCRPATGLRCREIQAGDIEAVMNLFAKEFPEQPSRFWARAFRRLTEHPTPSGYPKYGYLLEDDGIAVGAVLLIYSQIDDGGKDIIICNGSSWCVEPKYRPYASMLNARATRHKHVTYTDITPAPWILGMLEAQGYERYCEGHFLSLPWLRLHPKHARVDRYNPNSENAHLSPFEKKVLAHHSDLGCISVICVADGREHPFVFLPLRIFNAVPGALLAYCRSAEEFAQFAGPVGRFLCRHGIWAVDIGANGPIKGLVGKYFTRAPNYFKGPNRPRLGDIAFSERVIFGF